MGDGFRVAPKLTDGISAETDETAWGEQDACGGGQGEKRVEGAHPAHGPPDSFRGMGFFLANPVDQVGAQQAADHGDGEQNVIIVDGLA